MHISFRLTLPVVIITFVACLLTHNVSGSSSTSWLSQCTVDGHGELKLVVNLAIGRMGSGQGRVRVFGDCNYAVTVTVFLLLFSWHMNVLLTARICIVL